MWRPSYDKNVDLEYGRTPLYPTMTESTELRWSFIRKIYVILALQLLLTVLVASVVSVVHPISNFFLSSTVGLGVYIGIILVPLIVLWPLSYYYQKHPVNLVLLTIFTTALALAVGVVCASTKGKIVLEAVILTAVVVITLTVYTFWAAKRGHDFNFLGPFLSGAVMVLIVFSLIQIFFPMGKITTMIYGGVGAIIFCGYIIYDTDNLIKRYSYDEYIWASVALYLDIINLFLHLLTLLRAADS